MEETVCVGVVETVLFWVTVLLIVVGIVTVERDNEILVEVVVMVELDSWKS